MPRNISFMLTTKQVIDQTKTVTRRNGWRFLKVGDILNGCKKCQGLKAGEKIEKLCKIRVTGVRFEPLRAMTDDPQYGFSETIKEGFPFGHLFHTPERFVDMFCKSHKGVTPDSEVTRIEFEYLSPLELEPVKAGAGRRKNEIQNPIPIG